MIGASSREPIGLKPIHWKLQLDQTNTSMRVPSRPAAAHALTSNGPVKFTDSVTGWLFAVNTHTAGTRLYSLLRAETDVSREALLHGARIQTRTDRHSSAGRVFRDARLPILQEPHRWWMGVLVQAARHDVAFTVRWVARRSQATAVEHAQASASGRLSRGLGVACHSGRCHCAGTPTVRLPRIPRHCTANPSKRPRVSVARDTENGGTYTQWPDPHTAPAFEVETWPQRVQGAPESWASSLSVTMSGRWSFHARTLAS